MEVSGPSHEDIMASNILAFLSSSELQSATFPSLKSEELSSSEHFFSRIPLQGKPLLNHSNSSSRSSSVSMKSNVEGGIVSGSGHEFSDLDDDGLQGNRMKPLSSLQNNCANSMRFAMPQFSKRKTPNSHSNSMPSKVLAAARVGHKARRKEMYSYDNKENNELHATDHIREMKQTCPKHKGVKRRSPKHEGNARSLLLKRRRSTLSSWRTMMPSLKNGSSVGNMGVLSFISDCNEVKVFTQKAKPLTQKEANPSLEAPDVRHCMQGNSGVLQGAAISQQTQLNAPAGSNLAACQGSSLPALGTKDQSSSLSCAERYGKGLQSNTSSFNEENLVGYPCTKPPTYPKVKQHMSTVVSTSFSGKEMDAVECNGEGNMNSDQASSSLLLDGQSGRIKIEEDASCFMGKAGNLHKESEVEKIHANCFVPHFAEVSATGRSPMLQADGISNPLDPKGMSAHPCLLMPDRIKSSSAFQNDKVLALTQPQYFVDGQTSCDSDTAVRLTQVKQEYSSEASLYFQNNSGCGGSLPGYPSTSGEEDIKGSMAQNLSELSRASHFSGQVGSQMSRSHPIVHRGATTIYQQSQHKGVCLPRARRGRPPRKSNLCPCPETKENMNKFTRICGPSGILGKLNPGIISRLRDKKQVYAVLEAVIRGAFMTGMKENLGLKNAEELDVAHNHRKEREALKSTSDKESALKLGLVDHNTKAALAFADDKERHEYAINRAGVQSMSGHKVALGPCGAEKLEQRLLEPNEHMGFPLPSSEQCSEDVAMDSLEACEVNRNKQCSIEAADKQKCHTDVSIVTGNVASCWLELLRLDIKGRLSALKRSKRRVRGVIVSGQLDDIHGKVANQADEMERWRAFFLHMEHVLCLEGTRLESWLNQITQMQSSYCQNMGSHQSLMPPLCGIGTHSVGMDGGNR